MNGKTTAKTKSDSLFLAGLFLLAFCLLILPGCGRERKAIAVGVSPKPTVDPNVLFTPTPTPTPMPPGMTPTPTPGLTAFCGTAPFLANGGLLGGSGFVLVGQPAVIHLEAAYCAGVTFQVEGRESEPRFTSAVNITKTYSAPGSVSERFLIKAYDPINPSQVMNVREVVVNFQVVSPEATATCTVSRVTGPVLKMNDPISIRIDSPASVASAQLNGRTVSVGTVVQLLPTAAGSGKYVADVRAVTTGGQNFGCSNTFQLPTCEHEIVNLDWPFFSPTIIVTSKTTFYGDIASATVNGAAVTVGSSLPIVVRSYLPYNRSMGSLTSAARAVSVAGDVAECSTTVVP